MIRHEIMLSRQGIYQQSATMEATAWWLGHCYRARSIGPDVSKLVSARADQIHCKTGSIALWDVDIETHKGSSIYLGFALSPYAFTRLTSRDETGKIPPRLVTIKEE